MTATTEDPPNVLLVLTDQQRWDTVGAYDSPIDITPTIDRLAEEGTRIERAITPQPLCGPFRAAFHTGKHATETGVWRNSIPLEEDEQTIANHFSEAGYDVGFVGTWHIASTVEEPVPAELRGGYEDYWCATDLAPFTTRPHEGYLFDDAGERIEFDQYRADAFTDFAEKGIDTLEEPFFLVVGYMEPHYQNDMRTSVAPDGYAERHERDPYVPPDLQKRPGDWYKELPDYYGIIERLDECVDRLLSALTRKGIRDETVFAFTSDHGCHFRTRPGEYKRTAHESAVRVPAILSGPGLNQGQTVERVTSLLDIPPTLLDVAGIDVPNEMAGESLLPVIESEEPDRGNEVFIQISEAEIGRALRTDRWKYAVSAPTKHGWRGGSGSPDSDTYVERYLYDLYDDPNEQVNLVGRHDYRDVADDLRRRLQEKIRNVEGVDPEINPFENPGYQKY